MQTVNIIVLLDEDRKCLIIMYMIKNSNFKSMCLSIRVAQLSSPQQQIILHHSPQQILSLGGILSSYGSILCWGFSLISPIWTPSFDLFLMSMLPPTTPTKYIHNIRNLYYYWRNRLYQACRWVYQHCREEELSRMVFSYCLCWLGWRLYGWSIIAYDLLSRNQTRDCITSLG